jgi:hypothetical protein
MNGIIHIVLVHYDESLDCSGLTQSIQMGSLSLQSAVLLQTLMLRLTINDKDLKDRLPGQSDKNNMAYYETY